MRFTERHRVASKERKENLIIPRNIWEYIPFQYHAYTVSFHAKNQEQKGSKNHTAIIYAIFQSHLFSTKIIHSNEPAEQRKETGYIFLRHKSFSLLPPGGSAGIRNSRDRVRTKIPQWFSTLLPPWGIEKLGVLNPQRCAETRPAGPICFNESTWT